MKHYEVVAAIIIFNGKVLCMQRNKGAYDYTSYKYEFPGGKIEPGETKPEALMRELREEMAFEVAITDDDYVTTVTHQYPDFEITMYCYKCYPKTDYFVRKEHINHAWVLPFEMHRLDWAAADIPVMKKVQEHFS